MEKIGDMHNNRNGKVRKEKELGILDMAEHTSSGTDSAEDVIEKDTYRGDILPGATIEEHALQTKDMV